MKSQIAFLTCVASVLAALASGCNSVGSSRQSLQLKPSDIVATVFKPEYKVRNVPVTATAVQKHFLFFSWGDADLYTENFDDVENYDKPEVRRLKKAASSKACNAANCDLLVATTYQFERGGFLFSTVKCTVKGFPTDVISVSSMSSPNVTREIRRIDELDPSGAPSMQEIRPPVQRPAPAATVARPSAPATPRAVQGAGTPVRRPASPPAASGTHQPVSSNARVVQGSSAPAQRPARTVEPQPVAPPVEELQEIRSPAVRSEIPVQDSSEPVYVY